MMMFVKCFDFVPHFQNKIDGARRSEDYKPYYFAPGGHAEVATSVLNSTTFFLYFVTLGDCFHCGRDFVPRFLADLPRLTLNTGAVLAELG